MPSIFSWADFTARGQERPEQAYPSPKYWASDGCAGKGMGSVLSHPHPSGKSGVRLGPSHLPPQLQECHAQPCESSSEVEAHCMHCARLTPQTLALCKTKQTKSTKLLLLQIHHLATCFNVSPGTDVSHTELQSMCLIALPSTSCSLPCILLLFLAFSDLFSALSVLRNNR